jgi:hypothetical protein
MYNNIMASFNNPPGKSSFNSFTQPVYDVNTSHPLIPNSQEYIQYNKYVSIHSEDRDLTKFPNASDFEIEMPEDMLNVASIKLVNWTFPANYNTFSGPNQNVLLTFSITAPYNPAEFGLTDELNYRIYEALFMTQQDIYGFIIEDGFYNPLQMATELTNKFNFTVNRRIGSYFLKQGWTTSLQQFRAQGGYSRFIVIYNVVSQKLWFGNRADGFTILSEVGSLSSTLLGTVLCGADAGRVPDGSNWGLPSYLGLSRCNVRAASGKDIQDTAEDFPVLAQLLGEFIEYNGVIVPRFYYGDVTPGDDGFWLLPYPQFTGSQVYWVEPIYKINLMGEAYMYLELDGHNCIDETQPYDVSTFTTTTNQTNGVVNSSFAKLAVPTTPISQWFDRDAIPYKMYNPPAERIRKLKIKLRYHNGSYVIFGNFNYSFMLQFTLLSPQILRNSKTIAYPPAGR